MIRLSKLIPLATIGGLGYAQRDNVVELAEKPLDIVRVAATQYELAQIRQMISLDLIAGVSISEIAGDFADYLREHFRSPERDTSQDFWSNPYQLDVGQEDADVWSYGPDGWADSDDDIWVVVDLP